jgi:eukaryotic-like serine/threonine-protein kinase
MPRPSSASLARAASASGSAPQPARLPDADEPDFWIGRLVDGRYRVISRLGQGGMGLVYKVEHQRMGKIAAMKVLHRDLATDKEVVKRFRREAEAVSKLTHPNTVQTFDFGTSDGAMYLVMEYVRGEDLGTVIKRDGAMPFLRAAPLFAQICGALSEAHELGIVHRDLKPENIIVTRTKDGSDHVKVLDFGLAKLSEREEVADVTGRGSIVGTPYYMSPEQIRGESLDHRSDIYSLGAMMYRVITGEPPFQAQTPVGVLTKHLTDEVVPPRRRRPDLEIDTRVEAIVLRAMSKRRESRYATVDSMREDLERAREELSAAAAAAGQRPSRGGLATAPRTTPLGGMGAAGANGTGPNPALPATTPRGLQAVPELIERREGSTAQPRLKREDFDAFERSLRRRSLVNVIIIPLLVVLVAAAGWAWWTWTQAQPRVEEREPNNELTQATLIAPGSSVKGQIASRLSEHEGDKDYFRVPLTGASGAPVKLSATLMPIRNMDLVLYVLDRSGRRLAVVDNFGVGQGESLPNVGVPDAVAYVAVQETRGEDELIPTENVTDEYTLTVAVAPFAADEEREPNEADSDATKIGAGQPMRGTLARWRDVDKWRFDGDPGTYVVEVTGGEGLPPVQLRLGSSTASKTQKLEGQLAAGQIISVERADPDAAPAQRKPVAGAAVEYTLSVRKK